MEHKIMPIDATPSCASSDPETWFSGHQKDINLAIKICGSCAVREACQELYLGLPDPMKEWGIWGQENALQTERQRSFRERKSRQRQRQGASK